MAQTTLKHKCSVKDEKEKNIRGRGESTHRVHIGFSPRCAVCLFRLMGPNLGMLGCHQTVVDGRGTKVANELLVEDPAEYKAVLEFLQECGWPKNLSLSDILGVEPQRPAKVTAPDTARITPLR